MVDFQSSIRGDAFQFDADSIFSLFEKPVSSVESTDLDARLEALQSGFLEATVEDVESDGQEFGSEGVDGYSVLEHSDSVSEKKPKPKRSTSSNNRRTKELEKFLSCLDSRLDEVADLERMRPFCSHPGCDKPSEEHCYDCIGFFCTEHHADEGHTHTKRVWNNGLRTCRKTVLMPGFQDTSELGRVNVTNSFCRCKDPSPAPFSIMLLRQNLSLHKVQFGICPCHHSFAILHRHRFLQINSKFAVHFGLLKQLRKAEHESLKTWVDLISMKLFRAMDKASNSRAASAGDLIWENLLCGPTSTPPPSSTPSRKPILENPWCGPKSSPSPLCRRANK